MLKKGLRLDVPLYKKLFIMGSLATFFVLYFCSCYGDVFITANHGINFWDALFDGKILDFYELNLNARLNCGMYNGPYSAYYDFFIYIIFAVWNFPLWAVSRIWSFNALNTVLGALWAKAISLPFLAAVVYFMYKIAALRKSFDKKHTLFIIYLFITSTFTAAYTFTIGQYDVITLSFILCGLYAYLKDKNKLFILMFSLAIPIKAFSLLIFVPLLLYKQKNLLKILLSLVLALAPMLAFRVIIPFAGKSNMGILFPIIFSSQMPLGYGTALFVVLFAIFVIACYIAPKTCGDQNIDRIIYISFLSFALFLFLSNPFPYWFMYLTPFVFLVMLTRPCITATNALLESAFSFCIVLLQSFHFAHCFSSETCHNTLLSVFIKRPAVTFTTKDYLFNIFGETFVNENLNSIYSVLMGLGLAAVIVFAFINLPKAQKIQLSKPDSVSVNTIYTVRFLLSVAVCLIPIICYL